MQIDREARMNALAEEMSYLDPNPGEILTFNLVLLSKLNGNAREAEPRAQRPQTRKNLRPRGRPKGTRRQPGPLQHAIIEALKDEQGPLVTHELAERVGSFGYDSGGAEPDQLKARINTSIACLRKRKIVESRGRGIGYALIEAKE